MEGILLLVREEEKELLGWAGLETHGEERSTGKKVGQSVGGGGWWWKVGNFKKSVSFLLV